LFEGVLVKKNSALFGLLTIVLLLVALAGCKAENTAQAKPPLKIGALSMMTVLPLHVAQREGLFQAQGVNVEIVPFHSQIERDTALVAGQIDGIVEDIYSAPVLNRDSDLIKIVAVSPVESYMFAVVVSKESRVRSPADLNNVEIGVSLGNIIEYVTDQMCVGGGLKTSDLKKISVPSMPLRLEMMNQGKIEAATFSRPLSDMALLGGGRIILDDSQQSLLASSIMVSTGVLKSRPDDVRHFLKAWSLAARKISADPAGYRSLLVSVASISPDLADKIEVPKFDPLRLPTQQEYQAKLEWNLAQNNLKHAISYQDIVAGGYLP
jgi:NitT/TauT family transport system substrate-binding protein